MGGIDFLTMSEELIFASQNNHKRDELNRVLKPDYKLITLKDLGYTSELEEDFETIEENARQKAFFVYQKFQRNCLSEDTALEVDALNGEPGVHTAFYAGKSRSALDNMNLLLLNLIGNTNRKAQFRTILCLIIDGIEFSFEGVCVGTIAEKASGNQGFGYDPVFIPDGYKKTFAEMDNLQKVVISHRTKAAQKLKRFLAGRKNN